MSCFAQLIPQIKNALNNEDVNFHYASDQNCEKWILASSCLSLCPFVRIKQLGSRWTDFHEISYLSDFRKYVPKIQISLMSDKNIGYNRWRPIYIYIIISRSIPLRMQNIPDRSCTENQNTFYVKYSFIENCAVYEITWENILQRRTDNRRQYTARALYAGYLMLQTHNQNM